MQLPFLEVLGFSETPFRYVICLRAREAREDSIGGLSLEIVLSFLLFCGFVRFLHLRVFVFQQAAEMVRFAAQSSQLMQPVSKRFRAEDVEEEDVVCSSSLPLPPHPTHVAEGARNNNGESYFSARFDPDVLDCNICLETLASPIFQVMLLSRTFFLFIMFAYGSVRVGIILVVGSSIAASSCVETTHCLNQFTEEEGEFVLGCSLGFWEECNQRKSFPFYHYIHAQYIKVLDLLTT
jgi:hypothetical protein